MADAGKGINHGTQSRHVVLARPRLGLVSSNPFAADSTMSSSNNPFALRKTTSSVLRPPQLKPFTEDNPFHNKSPDAEQPTSTACDEDKPAPDSEKKESSRVKDNGETSEDAPKFVPLASSTSCSVRATTSMPGSTRNTNTVSSAPSFVFGQNLSERAVVAESTSNGATSSKEHSSTNGNAESLFVTQSSASENHQEEACDSTEPEGGLLAAAAEYERARARPPPPPPSADTRTGEEEEVNVLQIACRLFSFEQGTWQERGRGQLRLNDGAVGSRLLARTSGSLRLLLNAKLWPGMVAERAGARSLRVTATDAAQQLKIFLVMGAPNDISQLHQALTDRLFIVKKNAETSSSTSEVTSTERLGDAADSPQDNLDLHTSTEAEADSKEFDDYDEDSGTKSLKRKDSDSEEGSSPKRQCPEVSVVVE